MFIFLKSPTTPCDVIKSDISCLVSDAINSDNVYLLFLKCPTIRCDVIKSDIDIVNLHFGSSQLRVELLVLFQTQKVNSSKTCRSMLNWLEPKCMFIMSTVCFFILSSFNFESSTFFWTDFLPARHRRWRWRWGWAEWRTVRRKRSRTLHRLRRRPTPEAGKRHRFSKDGSSTSVACKNLA